MSTKTQELRSKQHPVEQAAGAEESSSTHAQGRKEQAPSHEQIAECAYFIWLAEGQPSGQDVGHWCEAEAKVGGQSTDVSSVEES